MRKLLLAGLFISVTFFASAQITRGSTFIGGSLGISNSKQKTSSVTAEEGKNNYFSFSPAFGKAIKENLVAGISLHYGKSETEKYYQYSNLKTNTFGGGVFLRRYFPVANKFYLFGELDASFNSSETEQVYNPGNGNYESSTDTWNIQSGLTPGISYNLFKAFHLEMSFNNLLYLRYEKQKSKESNNFGNTITRETKNFSAQSSLSGTSYLNIGFRFIIPKK